jgi:hypothetical protein
VVLDHGLVKPAFAFEVVVKHRLVDARGGGNGLGPRAGETRLREGIRGGGKNGGAGFHAARLLCAGLILRAVHNLTNQMVNYGQERRRCQAMGSNIAHEQLAGELADQPLHFQTQQHDRHG